jgi:histidine triad (HIT) family protein
MDGCVFCRIADDRAESHVVWDDDLVLAIMDINPVTDGHCLVLPRVHSVGIDDIPAGTAARMMNVAQQLAGALKRSELRCEGVNLLFADGEAAFQEVFHSHLHVLPRFAGDGFKITANWGDGERRSRIGVAADRIRTAL